MVKEKIKKIKEGEEKADSIIEAAKKKAKEISDSFDEKKEKLIEEKETELKKDIAEYRHTKEKEKKNKISQIEEKTAKETEHIKRKEKKIPETAQKVWKELKKEIFRQQ
jgi:vacuolar-type H+-ATPase subunit H